MAKKEKEVDLELEEVGSELELNLVEEKSIPVKIERRELPNEDYPVEAPRNPSELTSCLRNEIVQVRHIKRESGLVSNPKHVFYGGMGENSVRIFTVPILESNGQYINVLTNSEKAFLEEYMGLPYNALSVYKKTDNYWEDCLVRLTKGDNALDLKDPNDYIKYKILLANKDFIAPSLSALQDYPKETYQFVIVSQKEETKVSKLELNSTMESYKEFGRYEDNVDVLRFVAETLGGRILSANTKIDFLQTQIDKFIKSDAKAFLQAIKDPYLETKILIRKSLEEGTISKKGDFYYLKADNSPLCENGENPTLSVAARFLNQPKRQEIKFLLEAKLNK